MASLFSTAIVAACVGVNPTYHEACDKALDAGTRQAGWRDSVDRTEDGLINYTTNKVKSFVSKDVVWVVGSGAFIYRTARDKSINFRLPTLGVCSSASSQVTVGSYQVNLNWNF